VSPKNKVIVAGAAVSLLEGIVEQHFYPELEFPPTEIVAAAIISFLIFLWYRLDAGQLNYRHSWKLDVAIIAVALIAFPYYLFRSRGVKQGMVGTVLFILAFAASLLLTAAGAYLLYVTIQS
jgi:tellurite resistance protein TehA-like permease